MDIKEYKKAWYEKNKTKIKAKSLIYYYENIDKCKENQKKYRNSLDYYKKQYVIEIL